MKFRALNFDYHGEATLQWAEEEKEQRSKGKSLPCILLCKDCYGQEEKKNPPAMPPEPQIGRTETVVELMESVQHEQNLDDLTKPETSATTVFPAVEERHMDDVASKDESDSKNYADIPSQKTMASFRDQKGCDCTVYEQDDMLPPVIPHNDAENKSEPVYDTQHPLDTIRNVAGNTDDKSVDCVASVADDWPVVVHPRTNANANYQPPLLSCSALQDFLRHLYSVSNSVRLANEPWHDRLPQHFELRLFWREPGDFLPADGSNEEAAHTLFQKRKSLSMSRVSKRIKTIAANLGHRLQIVESSGSASDAQSPFSFSLLEMLRGGTGTFGLRRVQKSACRDQLAAERGAIVPYTGPLIHRTPEAKIIPPPELVLVMQIALAVIRHQQDVASSKETDDKRENRATEAADSTDNAEKFQGEVGGDGGAVRFSEYLQKHKKRSNESVLLSPSRSRTSSSLKVSFAYSPTDPKNKKTRYATEPPSGRTGSTFAEEMRKTQCEASLSTNKSAGIEPKSSKAKKKRTAEEKAARKKHKQERKARRQEKSHEQKRTCSESVDPNCLQQNKRLKAEDFDAGRQLSPKRPCALLRSVVSEKSPRSSRRVSVADGLSEFEKTRAVLNNIKHENRSAFSQMKLPRSTVARSVATAMGSFEWSTNGQEQKGIRGPSQSTTATVSKPVPRQWREHAPAVLSDSASGQQLPNGTLAHGAIPQNRSYQDFCRQQPKTRSLSATKSFVNGIAPKPAHAINARLYSTTVQGRPVPQHRESVHREIPTDGARKQKQAIGPSTLGNKHSQLHTRETAHQAPAGVPTVALESATPLSLLCSEPFLESWCDVVAELACGHWKQCFGDGTTAVANSKGISTPGRGINLVDSPLVNECGVDIEAPGRSGLLVYSVSALEAAVDARAIVLGIATLAATGRYKNIYIFLSYDTDINLSIAKHLTQLQCATIRSNGLPETTVIIKTASPSTLSFALAQTLFSLSARGGKRPLKYSIIEGVSDSRMQQRARFLLTLVPLLSASGSIETLLVAKQCLPNGSPYFRLLFQNPRLRQKIMLAATAENAPTEIHPDAMVQLSHILKL